VIKIKIPGLLEQNNLNATDLMRKGNIAYGTALRLSKGEGARISFDVLENLCMLFDVGVEEILEYVPDKNS
jgi:DNA-binding Xre family transcriptional regulator